MKILIGCPTSDYHKYCLKEYIEGLKSFTYPNFDVLLVDNSKNNNYTEEIKKYNINVIKYPYTESARDRIINSRNLLREKFLKGNYDYFFSLEQDVIPPKDIIERLSAHKKEIVSGVYFAEKNLVGEKFSQKILLPVLYDFVKDKDGKDIPENMRFFREDELNNGLKEVKASGLGCILIHKKILENIKFRYDKDGFDDVFFCQDARAKGFKIFADTSIICKHLIKNRPWNCKDIKK